MSGITNSAWVGLPLISSRKYEAALCDSVTHINKYVLMHVKHTDSWNISG